MPNLPYLLIQFCSLLRRAATRESKEVIKRQEKKYGVNIGHIIIIGD